MTPAEEKDLPVAELLNRLSTTEKGLSSSEATKRLQQFGPNEIAEKKRSAILAFLRYFWGPIAVDDRGGGHPLRGDTALGRPWRNHHSLLSVNAIVRSWQENKASNAIELLKKRLALRAKVLRDGKWADLPAAELVPGDIVRLRLGNIVPADTKLIEGDIPPDRRVGAHGRVPAGREASGRRRLLFLDRPAGRDGRAWSPRRDEHLLRTDHEAGRGSRDQEPLPGSGREDRRLSHRARGRHGHGLR